MMVQKDLNMQLAYSARKYIVIFGIDLVDYWSIVESTTG
jgi:hypothetical protein